MSILRLRKLAGYEVPSFYDYARTADAKVKEIPVELTEAQWLAFDSDYKGTFKGERHILVFENGALQMIPIKTAFIGGVDNTAKEEKVEVPKENVKDETTAVGGDPEAAAKARIAAAGAPEKNASTPEPTTELGAEKPKEEDLQDEQVTKAGENVKESAEEKAKKLIAAVKSSKRITDTDQTQVDSNTTAPAPSTELGAEKPKECDLQDNQADDPKKVAESAEEIAKRIIASVKGGNHPHDAKNDGDDKAEKPTSFDYNKEVVDGKVVSDPASNEPLGKDTKVIADKTGETQRKDTSVEVPSKVVSQIDQRLSELKAAKEQYDEKGYNDISVKQNAIDFLEKIKEHLALRDVEGLMQAQVLFGTLMSPVTDLLPSALVNFLATARNSQKTTGTNPET